MRRVPSSPRRAAEHAGAALVCAAVLSVGCTDARPEGPVLSIFETAGTPGPGAQPLDPAAVSLALAGLEPGALERVRAALAMATDVAVKRANPLLVDLVPPASPPTRAALSEVLRAELPAATAASNLMAAPWRAEGLRVELGPACQPGATRCVSAFGAASGDAIERRARGVAWAWSHAAVLRPKEGAPALVQALRARRTQAASTLALVLTAETGELDGAAMEGLRHQASRALAHAAPGSPEHFWLDAISKAPGHWTSPVALQRGEVLVVPRLGVLARLHDFEAELISAGSFEWRVRGGSALP
jgi:hypothetical protein